MKNRPGSGMNMSDRGRTDKILKGPLTKTLSTTCASKSLFKDYLDDLIFYSPGGRFNNGDVAHLFAYQRTGYRRGDGYFAALDICLFGAYEGEFIFHVCVDITH